MVVRIVLSLFSILFLITNTANAQQFQNKKLFELSGTINDKISSKKIYLSYKTFDGKSIIDSSLIVNNKFVFKGFITDPIEAIICNNSRILMTSTSANLLYLEPKKLNLSLDYINFKNSKLTGSKTHDEYCLLQKLEEIPLRTRDSISKLYDEYYDKIDNTNDSLIVKDLNSKIEILDELSTKNNEIIEKIELDFIKQNPSSFVSLNKLLFILGSTDLKYFDAINSLNKNLTKEVQNSDSGKELNRKLETIGNNIAGIKAPVFTVYDSNGELLSLSSFKNRNYVLLEFWASWCAPCREGISELKDLYSKYNSEGFEIIGVTLDKNLDSWKKAIVKENIEKWKHFSISENQNNFEKLYYVQGIPQRILINKDGVIIGRWVGENTEHQLELRKILSEIFNK